MPSSVLYLRLDIAIHERIADLAAELEVTMSEVAILAITYGLKEAKAELLRRANTRAEALR